LHKSFENNNFITCYIATGAQLQFLLTTSHKIFNYPCYYYFFKYRSDY